ncbi:hypothetical protein SEEC0006_10619 [Salmonella enterica subsp. enterica serovar Choleraesuis str. 0006]|nr:hypothetical protein SEEC0006_10619 [Salmonella enterica subsp. enterica serovar Choleraesuis str. 0006]
MTSAILHGTETDFFLFLSSLILYALSHGALTCLVQRNDNEKGFLLAALFAMSNSSFAAMAESCQQYFNDIDALVEQAAATSEQAKQQFDAMKPQLEASKNSWKL